MSHNAVTEFRIELLVMVNIFVVSLIVLFNEVVLVMVTFFFYYHFVFALSFFIYCNTKLIHPVPAKSVFFRYSEVLQSQPSFNLVVKRKHVTARI